MRTTPLSSSGFFPWPDKPASRPTQRHRLRSAADRSAPFPFSSNRSHVTRRAQNDLLFRSAESSPANPTPRVRLKSSRHCRRAFPRESKPVAGEHWSTQGRVQTNSSPSNVSRDRNLEGGSQVHPLRQELRDPQERNRDIHEVPARRKRKRADS